MDEAGYRGTTDELARCLADARAAADSCEQLLEAVAPMDDAGLRKRVLDAVVAPVAVARVLLEFSGSAPPLALGAVSLGRETARESVARLEPLADLVDARPAVDALAAWARSCDRLVDEG
jgi:hypothetical protein